MNAYTRTGQARIQPHDIAAVRPANRFMVGGSRAGLEWLRDCQAEAEVNWRLKQHGVMPHARTSFVSMLRQTLGAALVHAGERLAGGPRSGVSREPTSLSKLGPAN
jgi:hypothetical protein